MSRKLKNDVEKLTTAQKAIVAQTIISNYRIQVIPDKSLLRRIGESGHTIYEAIAEFIDNAIDAMTPEQKAGIEELVITIVLNAKKKYFSITDNGRGMNKETLGNCAKLGHSEKTSMELGYAGIGVKSGALTLSDNFIVTSGIKGETVGNEFEYDEKEFLSSSNGWELPARSFPKNSDAHGTSVKITKVTRVILSPAKTQYLKSDIAKRYRSFIQKGQVKIIVNNVLINVEEINWNEGYPIEFKIPTKFGEIYGNVGLMKESSQKGYYGFDIFRNGRMIVTNSKFAIGEHPTTARICGEIHLNFVKVSHEKNKFLTETSEYETAEQACKSSEVFKTILREARKKSEEGDNKKENVVISTYIEENIPIINYAIKELEYDLPTSAGKGKTVAPSKNGTLAKKLFGLIGIRKYEKHPDTDKSTDDTKERKKYEKVDKVDIIEVNGQKFKVKVEFVTEKGMGRKNKHFDNGILTIYVNKAYAGFKLTKDKNSYCLETVQDAIIEFMFTEHEILVSEMNERKESLVTMTFKYAEFFRDKFELDNKQEIEEVSEVEA